MSKRVSVVGPWPRPTGGVSTFVSRLLKKDRGVLICELIDPYPGEKIGSVSRNINHRLTPFTGVLRWLWLWYRISFSQGAIVHLNFSGAKALLFCLLPLRFSRSWILTLHSGNLCPPSGILARAYQIALSRFSEVISLSPRQREFYASVGANVVRSSSSYIYCIEFSETETDIFRAWETKAEGFQHRFVASGYPSKIYNHLETIKYVTCYKNSFLTLFIYGPDTEGLLKELLSYNELPNCMVLYECSERAFNDVLVKSHVYLRPNSVDSFGIAVADAINMSLVVFASDVCERYKGALVFASMKEYQNLIDGYVNGAVAVGSSDRNPEDAFNFLANLYGGVP